MAERGRAPLARVLGIGTAVPPHILLQSSVTAEASSLFAGRHKDFERMLPVFEHVGIRKRHSVAPLAWFREPRDWRQRTETYLQGAVGLFVEAAEAALADAGCAASAIDTVVTVSSTGIATPSLDAQAHARLGFRADVRRVPIFGLGCAGGVTGLSLAVRLAAADPGSVVLVVAVELCTLAFRDDELTNANIVATALFGDGAAAVVVSAAGRDDALAIEACGEHLWADTLDVMGWRVDPVGFGAVFSRSIPNLVAEKLRPAAEGFLARSGLDLEGVRSFVFHPGGAKVVDALERAFALPPGTLRNERDVLREFGNMSAPTVFFVLQQALSAGLEGRGLMSALGPGFTASFVAFLA
jgi:alkylresorcinol/alkylpyrone synthase